MSEFLAGSTISFPGDEEDILNRGNKNGKSLFNSFKLFQIIHLVTCITLKKFPCSVLESSVI